MGLRVALKYFAYGLLVGLFFAPRRGDETRQIVLGWVGARVDQLLGIADAPAGTEAPQA
jgi:hypothetical protein